MKWTTFLVASANPCTPHSQCPVLKGCRSYICMLNLRMVFARVLGLSYNAGSRWFHSFIHSTMCCMLSCCSRVRLSATPQTVAHQAPLSMGLSRQESWSGLPCPPPGDLPDPGIEPLSPASPALQADSSPLSHRGSLLLNLTVAITCVGFQTMMV